MYRLGDFFPRDDLFWGMQTGSAGIAFRLERNLGGFGDQQASAGTLRIIFRHQRRWDVTWLDAAQTSQRSHEHTVGEGGVANFERREQFFNLHSASYSIRQVD
ncbi:hypothetical protein D3C75_1256680 [compost metagenome]